MVMSSLVIFISAILWQFDLIAAFLNVIHCSKCDFVQFIGPTLFKMFYLLFLSRCAILDYHQ